MKYLIALIVMMIFSVPALADNHQGAISPKKKPLITSAAQAKITPDQVIARLKQGNQRFLSGKQLQKNYIEKAERTFKAQHPAAIILSCIDSRVPPELVFDQGVGNIFVTRVAANVINSDVLGGIEFATKAAGARAIVVMGHDNCGAVQGACAGVRMGHLSQLLDKIDNAIDQVEKNGKPLHCDQQDVVNTIAKQNVIDVVKSIPERSTVIKGLVDKGQVKIVGAIYHMDGHVEFLQ